MWQEILRTETGAKEGTSNTSWIFRFWRQEQKMIILYLDVFSEENVNKHIFDSSESLIWF